MPKTRKTFCPFCKRHAAFKVSQYKAGKASLHVQGSFEWIRGIGHVKGRIVCVRQEEI